MRVFHDHTGSFSGQTSIPMDVVSGKSVRVWIPKQGWKQPYLNSNRGVVPLEFVEKEKINAWIEKRARKLSTNRGILVLVGHDPNYGPPKETLEEKKLPAFVRAFLSDCNDPNNIFKGHIGLYHDQRYAYYMEEFRSKVIPYKPWEGILTKV